MRDLGGGGGAQVREAVSMLDLDVIVRPCPKDGKVCAVWGQILRVEAPWPGALC